MKLSSIIDYRFSDVRAKKQSAREFIETYLDSEHVNIILRLAEELNMTTEDATAHALAFFDSVQDLFNMQCDIELNGISVFVRNEDLEANDKRTINALRKFAVEPFKNSLKASKNVKSGLKKRADYWLDYDAAIQKMRDREAGIEETRIQKQRRKWRQYTNRYKRKTYYPKMRRIRKMARKRWEWAICI